MRVSGGSFPDRPHSHRSARVVVYMDLMLGEYSTQKPASLAMGQAQVMTLQLVHRHLLVF